MQGQLKSMILDRINTPKPNDWELETRRLKSGVLPEHKRWFHVRKIIKKNKQRSIADSKDVNKQNPEANAHFLR